MRPAILTRYIGWRFIASLGIIVGSVSALVFIVDYIEIVRDLSEDELYSPVLALQIATMRLPSQVEPVIPFAVLGAALMCLLNLSRRLELVVARASGVSVWSFLKAPLGIAIVLGLFATFVFNPVAVSLYESAQTLKAGLRGGGEPQSEEGLWFRQMGEDGPSIVYGAQATESGRVLLGVTVFVFDQNGGFREKVMADRAEFEDGYWQITQAEVVSAESAPVSLDEYRLATDLRSDELEGLIGGARRTSIWHLPRAMDIARGTGTDVEPFQLAFHTLLARPLFLMAMVVIAATVALRLSRFGGTLRLILTGVGAGFLLYVATEIVSDLGGNGIISPVLAAWAPSILALSFGATALLNQEDG